MSTDSFTNAALILCTLLAGAGGALVFRRLKIPVAGLLGAMFATGTLSVCGLYPPMPTSLLAFASNVVIGISLGRQIDRGVGRKVRSILPYVAMAAVGLIVLSLLCGATLYWASDVSLQTALIASTAGGIAEMMIFGLSMGADLSVIACVQLFRIVFFVSMLPLIVAFGVRRRAAIPESPPATPAEVVVTPRFDRRQYPSLALCAVAGAALLRQLGVPAGALIGAMLSAGACSVVLGRSYPANRTLTFAAQTCLGITMGGRITGEMVRALGGILLPALATTAVMLLGCTLLAYLLHRIAGWDLVLCLLCTSPAGLSQIAVYAEEIGADAFTASVFHTVRIISIVLLLPGIILMAT